MTVHAIRAEGESTHRRSQQKAAATLQRVAAAVFPQQKTTGSVLADPDVFTSFEQFSWLTHHKLPHSLLRFPQ